MSSAKPFLAASLPSHFVFGLVLASGFIMFTAWDQSYWWQAKEDYSFGWLVPIFAAYVIYDRWPKVTAQAQAVGRAVADRDDGRGGWSALGPIIAVAVFASGAVLFVFGAFYRAAAGVTHLSSLAISSGMAGIVLAAIYLLAPTRSLSASIRAAQRQSMTALFLFPVLVWLISAPMLSTVESNVALFLMHQITSTVFFVFDGLGLTLEQRGNVLVLPTGSVGVEEACSGIRSLTGCLFAGSVFAAVFVESISRKIVLVVASLVFAVGANLLRSLFLTSWAYHYGAKSIEGTIHDASGYAVLGLTVVALYCLRPLMNRWTRHTSRPAVQ